MTKSNVPVTHIEGANGASADTAQQTQAKDSARSSSADAAAKTKNGASIYIDSTGPAYDDAGAQGGRPTGTGATKEQAGGPYTLIGRIAPGHEHAVLGGLFGLVFAVLFFVIGFWQTLLVALLVFIGIAFGQYLDGDPKIINFIRRALTGGLDD